MNCALCNGNMENGITSLTFDLPGGKIIVVRGVPALICEQCGEIYVPVDVSQKVEKVVRRAEKDGVKMGFIEYETAA